MEATTITGVNVAPQSTSGHYIQNADVVCTNEENRSYLVTPRAESTHLKTKNHGDVVINTNQKFSVFTQDEYIPYQKVMQKAID